MVRKCFIPFLRCLFILPLPFSCFLLIAFSLRPGLSCTFPEAFEERTDLSRLHRIAQGSQDLFVPKIVLWLLHRYLWETSRIQKREREKKTIETPSDFTEGDSNDLFRNV